MMKWIAGALAFGLLVSMPVKADQLFRRQRRCQVQDGDLLYVFEQMAMKGSGWVATDCTVIDLFDKRSVTYSTREAFDGKVPNTCFARASIRPGSSCSR